MRDPSGVRVPSPALLAPLAAVCFAAASLAASVPLYAQQPPRGTVEGRVLDATRGAPVGYAEVTLQPLERSVVADAGGRFRFDGVPTGDYELRVRFLGFETTVREVAVQPGESVALELRIAPGPVTVEELEVSALSLSWFPGFLDRRERRTGHFFTRREIAEADVGYLTQLLRDRKGVRIGFNQKAHGHNKRYPQLHYTGPGRGLFCYPAIFVDGETIGPGQPYWHFNEIPPERVLAMEVYYRAKDIPEDISYTEYRAAKGREDAANAGEAALGPGAEPAVRRVLAGAGLEGLLQRRVPQRDEELRSTNSVTDGLWPDRPRIEGCGAIFVWTEFYPFGEG